MSFNAVDARKREHRLDQWRVPSVSHHIKPAAYYTSGFGHWSDLNPTAWTCNKQAHSVLRQRKREIHVEHLPDLQEGPNNYIIVIKSVSQCL